jgi:hypothetical protein
MVLPLTPECTAKAIVDLAATHGVAFSPRTAARIACDVHADANLGACEEQFQLFPSFANAIATADPAATTHLYLNANNDFVSFFVSWGFSQVAIQHVKPVVAIDGAHLSPDGTGAVRFSFILSFAFVLACDIILTINAAFSHCCNRWR